MRTYDTTCREESKTKVHTLYFCRHCVPCESLPTFTRQPYGTCPDDQNTERYRQSAPAPSDEQVIPRSSQEMILRSSSDA